MNRGGPMSSRNVAAEVKYEKNSPRSLHLFMSWRLTSIVQVNLVPNLKCLELWLMCKKLYPTGFVCAPSGNSWKLLYEEAHLTPNLLLLYCWKYIVLFADKDSIQLHYLMKTAFIEAPSTWNPVKSSEITDLKYCLLLLLLNAPTNLSELFYLGFKNLLCGKIDT